MFAVHIGSADDRELQTPVTDSDLFKPFYLSGIKRLLQGPTQSHHSCHEWVSIETKAGCCSRDSGGHWRNCSSYLFVYLFIIGEPQTFISQSDTLPTAESFVWKRVEVLHPNRPVCMTVSAELIGRLHDCCGGGTMKVILKGLH